MDDFEAWVHARSAELSRRAYMLTGDVHLAEDLLQDTLARVAERWPRLVRSGDPAGYARTVMYHLSVDWWRRRRARPDTASDEHPELAGAYDDHETVVRRMVLRDALARLTPRQRAVLVLRYYDDLTEVQAATVLGCSVSTVKSQARHAIRRLRELAPDLLEAFTPSEANAR